ncbi:MAG TPA: cytochrome c3 family protein [Bryobacteraceae bacterium]|nr:cytochrome c3 family protein [Bryobacteraceae bacterium]
MRLCLAAWFAATVLSAQYRDVIGVHDLSGGSGSPVTGGLPGSCHYCHAPHNGIGGATPLWNQKLSQQTYKTYTSSTYKETGEAKLVAGNDSLLCLSCHDGTVAPGQTQAYGRIAMSGKMKDADIFGPSLQGSHPNSLVLPIKDDPELVKSLVAAGKTADPTVRLIKGNIECNTCHDPHVQSTDKLSPNFLVRDGSRGQLCLACHDPKRVVTGANNRLSQWESSAHAIAANTARSTIAAPVGSYPTVGQNACISCHQVHNSPAPAGLLRAPDEQDCLLCHGGGSSISPAIPNIAAEFAKTGHPFPATNNQHSAGESVLLNQNRHATCVDCHNPHSSSRVTTFTPPPAIRLSQNNVAGISASDGVSVVKPAAANQFENCLRCHGASTGKTASRVFGYLPVWTVSAGDPLNIVPQFAATASSSHPVTHDRSSSLPQPSLRPYMLNLDGATQGRAMGVRILCTDCHNSDDNREFGGAGPNGPHGSKFTHILERRYEASQAPRPGAPIVNAFPNPDLSVAGPYALCAKCHDLKLVLANTSFTEHARHINDGFSCSACHTAHGLGSFSPTISGERLVNFDANVVAPNGPAPISYNRAKNTCNLVCHGQAHGSTPLAGAAGAARAGKIVHR